MFLTRRFAASVAFCLAALLMSCLVSAAVYAHGSPHRGETILGSDAANFAASVGGKTASTLQPQDFGPGALTAKYFHTCAISDLGGVKCWGDNTNGKLGDGSLTDRNTPVDVVGLSGAIAVAAAANHTCALLGDGTVHCWGYNGNGQLGDGTTTNRLTPVAVSGLANVVEISTGFSHTCARLNDNTVRCWGSNFFGPLGDGSSTDRLTPVAVSGLTNAAEIAAGNSHTCARLVDNTVRCWGNNGNGQLGDGTTTQRLTPVTVSGLSNAAGMAADGSHTCARLIDETVRCWGRNFDGELGDGTTLQRLTPAVVVGLTNVADIAAGDFHTCARLADDSVRCWGNNGNGQLGDGTTTARLTPVAVSGLSNIAEIAAGRAHTCARSIDGAVLCWGGNDQGQLGDGTMAQRLTSVVVSGLANVAEIAAGFHHTCARLVDATLRCWGLNIYGQLGDGTSTQRLNPVGVSGLAGVADIAAGDDHTCALLADGTVHCWGFNGDGQLGDGTSTNRLTPVAVPGLVNVVEIAAGTQHSCALLLDNTVRCWGRNGFGQLGDGSTTQRLAPVVVSGLANVAEIALGAMHTCARLVSGTMRCWGRNSNGALGDGTTTNRLAPVAVSGLTSVAEIAAGGDHTCVHRTDAAVHCWGYNVYGQLGDGTTTQRLTPVVVSGLGNFTAVAAGQYHTCGRLADSTVRCWGANSYGQIGDGTITQRQLPVAVHGLADIAEVATGPYHACARLVDNTVRCWGYNSYGQLGNGEAGNYATPQYVVGSPFVTAHTLTYSAGANGSISGTTPQSVNHGDDGAPINAVADIGYHFAQWSDANTSNPRTDTNVTADITVTATFAIDTFTVTATSVGQGAITPISQTVDYDGTAMFSILPAGGYHVVSVSGDTCTVTGGGNTYSAANIQANCAVTASFAIDTFTVTASTGGNGSITPISQTVTTGGTATFTVSPATGYHVASVSGDTCTVTGSGTAYSATSIHANCAVTASFAIDTFNITATSGGNGTITPSTQTIDYDGTAAFMVTPDTGYHVASVSGDNCTITGSAPDYSAANIQANCAVTATFVINTYTLTYSAAANGSISGDTIQTVNYGADGATVTAVPAAGHDFVQWSDGLATTTRTDIGVTADITVEAEFAPYVPSVITANGSTTFTGIAGQPLTSPLPSVRVTDAQGNPVGGVAVTFAAGANSGTLSGVAQTTAPDGIATLGGWTLDATPGSNTVNATAAGVDGSVTFTATGTSDATPLQVSLETSQTAVQLGNPLTWVIVIGNNGTSNVTGAHLEAALPEEVNPSSANWQCTAINGAQCGSSSGTGAIDLLLDLPANSSAVFLLTATVIAENDGWVTQTLELSYDATMITRTHETPIVLYRDGFEPGGDGAGSVAQTEGQVMLGVIDTVTTQALGVGACTSHPRVAIARFVLEQENQAQAERFCLGDTQWVRLAGSIAGKAVSTAWSPVPDGRDFLMASLIADSDRAVLLLTGTHDDLELWLPEGTASLRVQGLPSAE